MRNRILTLIAVAVATIALLGVGTVLGQALPGQATDHPVVSAPGGDVDPASIAAALDTPCASEDSTDCYWDASIRGNGLGTSFVNIEGHQFPLTEILGH